MYKAYIFDFDLTLVDSSEGIAMCFDMLLADEGYPPVPRDTIYRTIGKPMTEAMSIVTGETDPSIIKNLCYLYKIRYSDTYMTPNTHAYAETLPALKRIKENGAIAGIISTKTKSRIDETVQTAPWKGLIDFVIGINEVRTPKPDPEGLLTIMKTYGLQHHEILYIGDSLIDAETAKNAHVDFAAVTTGPTTAEEFESWPHVKIMKSLEEV